MHMPERSQQFGTLNRNLHRSIRSRGGHELCERAGAVRHHAEGVGKVARLSGFGKGASLSAGAFPRRFTDVSQVEQRRTGARRSGAERLTSSRNPIAAIPEENASCRSGLTGRHGIPGRSFATAPE